MVLQKLFKYFIKLHVHRSIYAMLVESTLIFATMPFTASLADDLTRMTCSASDSVCMYSEHAESCSRHRNITNVKYQREK